MHHAAIGAAILILTATAVCSLAAENTSEPAAIYHEPLRPQFHFTSQTNWLNDPNGLVYYAGEYHLFYQHNPSGIDWGNMTWGHAVSTDLMHWKQLPDAIKPDKLGTIFSGSAIIDWHNTTGFGTKHAPALVAMYTSAGDTSPESKGVPFSQCIAYSTDKGRTFSKFEGNPVLPHIIGGNRDPKLVWFEPKKEWTLALYLDGDKYGLFTSPDLKKWTQIQTIEMPGSSECPDFFEIHVSGESTHKWVLTGANGHYLVGDYDGAHFTPEGAPQAADTGANYYAVQSYSDIPANHARRIQIAWMNGGKYPGMPFNQQMSFPCELTLHKTPDGLRMYRYPVNEISGLWGEGVEKHGFALKGNPLSNLAGSQLDIAVDFEPGTASSVSLHVGGEEIRYDCHAHTITCLGRTSPLAPIDGVVNLRVLVDRTSIELFGNSGAVSMSSCYLPKEGNPSLQSEGGEVKVRSLKAHVVKSVWPE